MKELEDSLHTPLMERIGGRGPAIIGNPELFPEASKCRGGSGDELRGRNVFAGSGLLDLLAVLIDPGEKENRLAIEAMITREDVCENLLVGVAEMRRRVRVVDRGRDEKSLGHGPDAHFVERARFRQRRDAFV